MVSQFRLGTFVEERWGTKNWLTIYWVGGIGGNLLSCVASPNKVCSLRMPAQVYMKPKDYEYQRMKYGALLLITFPLGMGLILPPHPLQWKLFFLNQSAVKEKTKRNSPGTRGGERGPLS